MNKANKDPQDFKPLITISILIGILILTTFIPANWFGIQPVVYRDKPLDLSAAISPEEIAKDTNGDGAISWNEIISQTFITDASSTEAIKNIPIDKKSIAELNDPNNLTGSFSKNLYLASAYLKANNATDDNSQQAMISQLIAQEASKIVPTTYGYRDIKIADKEDKISLKNYGNNIAPILQEIVKKNTVANDYVGINEFLQTKNTESLAILTKDRDRVDSLLKKFLSISVPPSAAIYHLLAISRIATYRDTLDNLSKADTDPIRTRIALENYTNNLGLVISTPKNFYDYFNRKNIVFSPKEDGYIFTIGYTIK